MKRLAIFICLLFMTMVGWSQEVKTYRQQQGSNVFTYDVTITQTDDTYQFQSSRNQGTQDQQATTDLSYATNSFTFSDSNKGTNYTATRNGDRINVTGKIKNRDTKSEHKISGAPWYQFLEEPLGAFALASGANMRFWTLEQTQAMPVEMEATKIGIEEITINNTKVQAQRVRINLTGFYASFWHADYLYNAGDGSFLRVETTNGPGGEKVIIEPATP